MSEDAPIVVARIEGVGIVSAYTRADWRAAPRINARLTIHVTSDNGELGSCLWFVDGTMTERQGLDDERWAKLVSPLRDLLLERAVGKMLARIKAGPPCD